MAANSTEITVLDEIKEEGAQNPSSLVFHCVSCRTILGDSFAWVCADENLSTISLSAVTPLVHVATEDGMEISTEGDDLGSTFVTLKCSTCQSQIGRIYKTTPRQLDTIRDMYTLDCSSIKSYQLGSNTETSLKVDDLLEIPAAQSMMHEIRKIQAVVVTLSDKLGELENQVNNIRKRNESLPSSPHDDSSKFYNNRRTSRISTKRQLSDSLSNQSDHGNGQSKQKRKKVI